ncbi:MAG: hypothetical protein ABJF07_01830, partial [Nisaea sp.]|uniref:hypothetical protein n=1 Tax=Nisaea sp. TaxID=2024842 RepID=UPI003267094B
MTTYKSTFSIKRLWLILIIGMTVMFGTMLFLGNEIYREAPPIPAVVKSSDGTTLYTQANIERGQNL